MCLQKAVVSVYIQGILVQLVQKCSSVAVEKQQGLRAAVVEPKSLLWIVAETTALY